MQTTLEHTPPLVPLPIGAASYVPSLLDRAGERDALAQTRDRVWSHTTPILHFLGPISATPRLSSTRFTSWSKRMKEAVGDHPVYLDIARLTSKTTVKTGKGVIGVLDRLYDAMRKRKAQFIPVASIGEDFASSVNPVANCAVKDGHGLAICYRFRELAATPGASHESRLTDALEMLGVADRDSDLFIDAGYIGIDDEFDVEFLAGEIQRMLNVADWRTVTFLGTSIPAAMSEVEEGKVGRIDRREWKLWSDLSSTAALSRPLAFGDYGVQHPKPPSGGGPSMRRNIRYTTKDDTVVARAFGRFTDSDDDQYRELCLDLKGLPEFSGPSYSWGDRTIYDCAEGQLLPGSQEMWRGAGTAHHLQVVSDQLRGV